MIKNRILTCFILIISLSPLRGQASLTERLDSLIRTSLPRGSEVGVAVYDLTAKRELYNYRADKLSRPASNMKVLTVAAALSQLNYEEPFRTEVWHTGTIERDTLMGDLYVIGGFDPEFNEESLEALVEEISSFPFSFIRGKVYGDVSMKDSLYWGNGWSWDDTPAAYQPYMSPLMFNKGAVTLKITPDETGEPATVQCEPRSGYYSLVNETQSRTPAAGKFSADRNWLENGNILTIKGNVAGQLKKELNLYPSRDFFMHTFMERLAEKGIETADSYEYAVFLPDSTSARLARWETSLQKVIQEVLKKSDNLGAEALLCRLATASSNQRPVSWEEGLKAVRRFIAKTGHQPEHYRIADGSGLSNYNYISPALLVDILKYVYNDTRMFQRFYRALPIGGIDGTLKNRMKGGRAYRNVHAKTGAITGIASLSGYLKAGNGNDIAFAIINQNGLKASESRKLQDLICEMLCE